MWNGKMTQANFSQNFTRLALHWFHPGVDSFPVFVVAAFSSLSCTSRAFFPFRPYLAVPLWPDLHCFLLVGAPLTCVRVPVLIDLTAVSTQPFDKYQIIKQAFQNWSLTVNNNVGQCLNFRDVWKVIKMCDCPAQSGSTACRSDKVGYIDNICLFCNCKYNDCQYAACSFVSLKRNSCIFKPRPYFWHEIRSSTHREQFGESRRPSEYI